MVNKFRLPVYVLFAVAVTFIFSFKTAFADTPLKVLQLNLWFQGTKFDDGKDRILNAITQADADLVSLQEIEVYDKPFSERIANEAAKFGYTAHWNMKTAILSKLPVIEHKVLNFGQRDASKVVVKTESGPIAFYALHLDWRNYAPYLPRAYNPASSKPIEQPITDEGSILEESLRSSRLLGIQGIIRDAEEHPDLPIIIAGDFNEPSYLDWVSETKDLAEHNGAIVRWPVSSELEKHGFTDAYRKIFPNPVTHPGYTFPAYNPAKGGVAELTFAPTADERERIDYVFFKNPKLTVEKIVLFGPKAWLIKGERHDQTSEDPVIEPAQGWPTDHMGLLATFTLKE